MYPTAGTITAPQAALLSIIATVADKIKKIYKFTRFMLIYKKSLSRVDWYMLAYCDIHKKRLKLKLAAINFTGHTN